MKSEKTTNKKAKKPRKINLESLKELKIETILSRAKKGEREAQYELGRRYLDGMYVSDDDVQALDLGIEEDDLDGFWEESDWLERGCFWLKKAGNQGLLEAQLLLADFYNPILHWQIHHVDSFEETDGDQAVEWYQKAASQGDGPAEYKVADLRAEGYGLSKDKFEAFQQMKEAAKLSSKAAVWVGEKYEKGYPEVLDEDDAPDDLAAIEWYIRAVYKDDPSPGLTKLGKLYMTGTLLAKNITKAKEMFERSIEAEEDNDDIEPGTFSDAAAEAQEMLNQIQNLKKDKSNNKKTSTKTRK